MGEEGGRNERKKVVFFLIGELQRERNGLGGSGTKLGVDTTKFGGDYRSGECRFACSRGCKQSTPMKLIGLCTKISRSIGKKEEVGGWREKTDGA